MQMPEEYTSPADMREDDATQTDAQPTVTTHAEAPLPEDALTPDSDGNTEPLPCAETPTARVHAAHSVFDFVELLVLTLAAVLLITSFLFRHSVVDGASMESTLRDGDHLIISSAFYEPKVGDIIVFEDYTTKHKKPLVKRIIATAGQTVTVLSDTEVLVDGVLVTGGFTDGVSAEYTYPMEPVTVSEGCVFVMGDHRNNSTDSRRFGEITVDSILGKVLLRVYPFSEFGTPAPLPDKEQ